jgi:hypothetical protein
MWWREKPRLGGGRARGRSSRRGQGHASAGDLRRPSWLRPRRSGGGPQLSILNLLLCTFYRFVLLGGVGADLAVQWGEIHGEGADSALALALAMLLAFSGVAVVLVQETERIEGSRGARRGRGPCVETQKDGEKTLIWVLRSLPPKMSHVFAYSVGGMFCPPKTLCATHFGDGSRYGYSVGVSQLP